MGISGIGCWGGMDIWMLAVIKKKNETIEIHINNWNSDFEQLFKFGRI